MNEVPQAVRNMFEDAIRDMEADRNRRERERAKADPNKHRLTRAMDGHARYLYYDASAPDDAEETHYGYTTGRNAAGFFLSFRQIYNRATGNGRRDMFVAHKKRKGAKAQAERRHAAHLYGERVV